METTKFWKQFFLHINFPFEINDVKDISSNNGCTWINMKDGTTYYISIEPAEIKDRA